MFIFTIILLTVILVFIFNSIFQYKDPSLEGLFETYYFDYVISALIVGDLFIISLVQILFRLTDIIGPESSYLYFIPFILWITRFLLAYIFSRHHLLIKQFVFISILSVILSVLALTVAVSLFANIIVIAGTTIIILATKSWRLSDFINIEKIEIDKHIARNSDLHEYIDSRRVNKTMKHALKTIMYIEDHNRPRIIRILEYLGYWTGKIHTTGIMQASKAAWVDDYNSIDDAIAYLKRVAPKDSTEIGYYRAYNGQDYSLMALEVNENMPPR